MEEWDVYDINRNLTGKTICRNNGILQSGEYHLAVDAWFVNDCNQFLIQKRSLYKKYFPGLWAESAGGAVTKGEDSFQACIREIEEELGIVPALSHVELSYSYIRHGNAIVDVYLIRQNLDLTDLILQAEEVEDVRWASFAEINALLRAQKFVPTVIEGLYGILENNVVIHQEKLDIGID